MMNPNSDLILNLIIYGIVREVEQPTKAVQELHRKMRRKLYDIRNQDPNKFYMIEQEKRKLYSKAWQDTFGSVDTGAFVSLGYIIDILSPKVTNSLVGKKVLEKASASFFYARDGLDNQAVEIEDNCNRLSYNILRLLGFEQNTKLNAMKKQVYNTLILEGKIKWER